MVSEHVRNILEYKNTRLLKRKLIISTGISDKPCYLSMMKKYLLTGESSIALDHALVLFTHMATDIRMVQIFSR
jgi:hypothetical protein